MKNLDQSQVDLREKQGFLLKAAQNDLLTFCEITKQGFRAEWFHEIIADKLEEAVEKIQKNEKVRIIITIPPRMGKTEMASIRFPAWVLGKYPDTPVILSTYGAELSETVGMKTRDVITSEAYQSVFPGIRLREDQKAKAKWMTMKEKSGGRLEPTGGSFTAVGIGGAVTGIGGKLILIDDPHKSREEAESETVRETVWQYYRDTLYSRLEGYGAIILIMQRWHTDDLVGRVLADMEEKKKAGESYDEWEVINFPAIAEKDEYYKDKLVRKAGESLWPWKFPLPVLNNIRAQSLYKWSSQYQQDPIATEMQEFKEHMFRTYEEEDLSKKYLRYYTVVDPAISQKDEADNTVVLTVGKEVNGPNWYRVREDAGHFTPQQMIDLIFVHQEAYRSTVGIETVAYQASIKFAVIEEQKKRQQYFIVKEIKSRSNKEYRIRGLLPMYETGVIFHRPMDFEYERELLSFPRGRRDDRVDAMASVLAIVDNTSSLQKHVIPHWKGHRRMK